MVGKVGVGGSHPIRLQSMTTTPTTDVEATVAQSIRMIEAGCEIVRITAPTMADARALGEIRKKLDQKGFKRSRLWPISISTPNVPWKRPTTLKRCG